METLNRYRARLFLSSSLTSPSPAPAIDHFREIVAIIVRGVSAASVSPAAVTSQMRLAAAASASVSFVSSGVW